MLVASMAQGWSENACSLPARATKTFLTAPPASAGYEVLAQVELVELVDARAPNGRPDCGPYASKIKIRVIDGIKGAKRGDMFVVDTGGRYDDELVALEEIGDTAFIAGRFVTDQDQHTFFRGAHAAEH